MPTDSASSATIEDVPTTSRNFRIPDELYTDAQNAAKAEDEKVPAIVIRALRAYVTDPRAFNLAVAQIRSKK